MTKILVAWFAMLVVSMANGAFRDLSYGRHMPERSAHQIATVLSLVLLGIVIRAFVRLCPPASRRQAVAIGLLWLTLTLAFEFLFFHFVGGHSWSALLANYNVAQGRVWVLVPIWIATAPAIFYRVPAASTGRNLR